MSIHRPSDTWRAPVAPYAPSRRGRQDAADIVARIAGRQDGTVSRRQLLAAGLTRHVIDGLIADGHLLPIARGVFAVGHRTLPARARLWVPVLATAPDGVLGGWSVAEAMSVVTPRPRRPVTILVPPGKHGAPIGARVRRVDLLTGERTTVRGLPGTVPARALLDAAVLEGPDTVERMWRGFRDHGRLDHDEVQGVLERHHGERGTAVVRALFSRRAVIVGASESGLEEEVARLVVEVGLPEPQRNVPRTLTSGAHVRFDLFLPTLGVAIEADGPHHDDPEVAAADARRDAEAARDGIPTVRVSHRLSPRARRSLFESVRLRFANG